MDPTLALAGGVSGYAALAAMPPPQSAGSTAALAASAAPSSGAEAAKRTAIAATAQKFEASFLSVMIGEMFEGVQTAPPFGGGAGEAAFRSFLSDAMGKAMARRGGVGLSRSIEREMLKLQGLSPDDGAAGAGR